MSNTDQTAVLATWCDSPDHFISPRKVQTWLAEGDHARMVRAAAGVHGVDESAARRVRFDEDDASAHEQASRHRHSVNRALDEYYKVRKTAVLLPTTITTSKPLMPLHATSPWMHTAARNRTQATPPHRPPYPRPALASHHALCPKHRALVLRGSAVARAAHSSCTCSGAQLCQWATAHCAAL